MDVFPQCQVTLMPTWIVEFLLLHGKLFCCNNFCLVMVPHHWIYNIGVQLCRGKKRALPLRAQSFAVSQKLMTFLKFWLRSWILWPRYNPESSGNNYLFILITRAQKFSIKHLFVNYEKPNQASESVFLESLILNVPSYFQSSSELSPCIKIAISY